MVKSFYLHYNFLVQLFHKSMHSRVNIWTSRYIQIFRIKCQWEFQILKLSSIEESHMQHNKKRIGSLYCFVILIFIRLFYKKIVIFGNCVWLQKIINSSFWCYAQLSACCLLETDRISERAELYLGADNYQYQLF